MEPEVALRAAQPGDVARLMAWERDPGASAFVEQSDEAEHVRRISAPDAAVLVVEVEGEPVGAATLLGLDDPSGNTELRQFLVARRGEGLGDPALRAVAAHAFGRSKQVHRLWLDVVPHNAPARALYRRCGFTEEGILREAWVSSEGRQSLVVMSMLRPEWAADGPPPAA